MSNNRRAYGQAAHQQDISAEVLRLPAMNRAELRRRWRAAYGDFPPRKMSMSILRKGVAYRMQEMALGGLSDRAALLLRESDRGDSQASARLVREWHGKLHVVDVTATGYLYEGSNFRSLTAVAKHITGAHWPGPRFFGLRKKTRG